MPFSLTKAASLVWRDYVTDGVVGSGKHSVEKSDTRQWGTEIENYLKGTTALDQVDINGGAIDGTPIGAATPSTGVFSNLTANNGTLNGTYGGNPTFGGNPVFVGQPNFSGITNKSAVRGALDVQQLNANLTKLAALALADGNIIFVNASGNLELTTITTFARGLIDDGSASAARTTLGLGSIATKAAAGADALALTGTPGVSGQLAMWNADQDLISAADGVGGKNLVFAQGTFQTTIQCGGGSITLNPASDDIYYTRIGNLVAFMAHLDVDSVSSPSGDFWVPMPYENLNNASGAIQALFLDASAGTRTPVMMSWVLGSLNLRSYAANKNANSIAAGDNLYISGTFLTEDPV